MVSFLLLLLLVFLMFARNAGLGFFVIAAVWLAAAVFDPNIDSGLVWTLGFGLGYLIELTD